MRKKGKKVIGQRKLKELSKQLRKLVLGKSGHGHMVAAKSRLILLVVPINKIWADT